jgi:hypothetical protein
MINSDPPPSASAASRDDRVDAIVAEGPHGALVVAGIATFLVVAMWALFYLLVFVPRGALQ